MDKILKNVNWCSGQYAELEFEAHIYKDHIHWILNLDPQWENIPEDMIQSLDEYMKDGPIGVFKTHMKIWPQTEIDEFINIIR